MRDEMKKVPRLRFRGFSEDWELCKLGEESDVRDGTHDSPKYFDDGYPLVTSKNLKDFGLDLSDVSLISYKDFKSINKRSKVDIGDILFGMIGTIGNPVQIFRDDFAIKNVALIKEQRKILNGFLIHILKSPVFDRYIRNENAGGTQKFLALSKVRGFEFLRPNIEEQVRIGNLFKQIDNTITLHQRKLDQLKELKKAYLQLMFPKKDETVPRVRFADFEDDWQLCKLGETFSIIMGQSPNSENYTENPDDYILVQGNSDMKNNKVVPRIWTTQVTKKAEKGDLILSVRAPVGEIGKTDYNVVLGRGVAAVKGNDFIFQQLRKMKDSGYWTRYSTGSTFESINSNDIKEALINIPNKDEQQKIGDLFTHLDDAIILNQNKLNQLKSLKKSYLQNMFI
ncbi:restriction endonuclease subunit S [Enterococcus faecalis]|nr:restriction endonuclease subunit S [Enterococcus faecalis]MCD5249659.1 restriction endonuclease subunit S [Enterococcus faecalis]